jgi:EAL domain-containing protein (putative c-di-GMP-specific phosphodiesterase class I)
MYEAKRSGRGRWVRFEPWMQSHIEQRSAIEADLREALHAGGICLEYQPVMGISGGTMRCAAVEALARWQHPKRGTVAPAEFIAIAEDSGLIHELGQLVLDKACSDFVRWQASLGEHAPPMVSVNVSVAQLGQSGYTRRVQETLARYQMAPGHLQLEVTESMAAQDDDVLRRLRALRGLGVRIALDDFGTGYSSLSCLHLLPISTVKIDRSFTADLDRSAYHRTLVEATVRVAQALGISCVAEGLETSSQLTLVRKMGCDAVQGYLISRSLDSRQLANWLVNWQHHVSPPPEPQISAFSDFDLFDSTSRRMRDD